MADSIGISPSIKDNTLWWTDLNFMPSEDKNELWAAQWVFYLWLNAKVFVEPEKYKYYESLERLKLDKQSYINVVDPPNQMGGGGTATYFASTFRANPIDVHLDNIVRAKLDKICLESKLQVSEIDKFAKSQKQRDTDRILYQNIFRDLINDIQKDIGLPDSARISKKQDPYRYAKSLDKKDGKEVSDSIDSFLDYVRSEIKTRDDLVLYQNYIYKGDLERALELGLQHYLYNLNKWYNQCEYFNRDLKYHNRFCGLWYTDETSGRGVVEWVKPTDLFVLPFRDKAGEDITGYRIEKDITFGDFVRRFGTTLTESQLKEVFELNKTDGGNHGLTWSSAGKVKGSNAMIRIGFASCLTQDADKFAIKYVNDNIPVLERKPLTWKPSKNTPNKYQAEDTTRTYNVWYSWYYVPPPGSRTARSSQADWAWQSQYIFNLKKDYDMYRYGVDLRYAKSQLVVWRDERPSFEDVKQEFMPLIHTSWHNFQNYLINKVDGVLLAEEFVAAALSATDEANKQDRGSSQGKGNGIDVRVETMKMLKQGGMAFARMTDKNGKPLPLNPKEFVIPIQNGFAGFAEQELKRIMELYQMMMVSLAQNDVTEGQQAKPRTPVEGVQASMQASNNGTWFIEKPARECMVMFGERCIQWMLMVIKEHKTYGAKRRWEELSNVLGYAHALMMEGIEDLEPEEIGITVTLEDVHSYQSYVIELANKMADNGEVGREVVGLVMNQVKENWKYAYVLLMIGKQKRDKEKAEQEDLQHKRQLELQQGQLKVALAVAAGKGQAKDQNIQTQGSVDERLTQLENALKAQSQAQQKDEISANRQKENTQKAVLEHAGKVADTLAPA